MKKWERKIALMRVLGTLPYGDRLFDMFRVYSGKFSKHNLEVRWKNVTEMLRILRGGAISVEGKALAEIGSGWHPVFAPLMYGLGAASVQMTDISPHARDEFVKASVRFLLSHAADISKLSGVAQERLETRWRALLEEGPWRQVFASHGLQYTAPLEFSEAPWGEKSLDLVFSNSCLGFIPKPVLKPIFAASYHFLRSGGSIAHNIDGVDCLIGGLEFLKFSSEEWERVGCCKLHYQNRQRPMDYIQLAQAAGFEITYEERTPLPNPQILNRQALHADFKDLPEPELNCFHFLLAARKP
jgi:hypothetical protein